MSIEGVHAPAVEPTVCEPAVSATAPLSSYGVYHDSRWFSWPVSTEKIEALVASSVGAPVAS